MKCMIKDNGSNNKDNIIKTLTDNLFAVCSNNQWGIVDLSGKRIVNFLYDEIEIIQNYLIVAKDNKVGVLDEKGGIVINPSYNKIENALIKDRVYWIYDEISHNKTAVFGQYCKECIFDTTNSNASFFHRLFSASLPFSLLKGKKIINVKPDEYNFENLFILTSDDYCELFSIKYGIISKSRFDEIQELNDNTFAVRKGEKWGVLVADSKGELVIPCVYDRIVYEGGGIVLLCNNGLWGAKSFSQDKSNDVVDVPLDNLEICILDEKQSLFGVKYGEIQDNGDFLHEHYSILDKDGNIFMKLYELDFDLDSQCKIYNFDRILSSTNGKYGFVSANGYVTIPFKYDEIIEREDGLFDVKRIIEIEEISGDKHLQEVWGVLELSGKEVVEVKYRDKIPAKWEGEKVVDALTNKFGVLSIDGTEQVPCVYDHLIIKDDYIFFGYGGDNTDWNGDYNFFSGHIVGAKWGCMDKTGKEIITAKYDCYKIVDNYILAGRDGFMDVNAKDLFSDVHYGYDYWGVYDLYSQQGTLLFGGFNKIIMKQGLFLLHFGGGFCEWEGDGNYSTDDEDEIKNGRWLVLDENFISLIRDDEGKRIEFNKGFIVTITPTDDTGGTGGIWNIPFDILSTKIPRITENLMVCTGVDGLEYVVRLKDGIRSGSHNRVKIISSEKFFFIDENDYYEDEDVGIAEITEEDRCDCILINNMDVLTYPVNNYVFSIFQYDESNCLVTLFDIGNALFEPIDAISSIDICEVVNCIKTGDLSISIDTSEVGLKKIVLPHPELFDKSFQSIISDKKSEKRRTKKCYWVSSSRFTREFEYNEEDEDNDKYN